MEKMRGLDLFSGIGGIGLALSEWVRTICYCEADRYAQSVLLSRMQSNDIDRAPIWDDVRSLRGEMLPAIDVIFGGFPCQDISVAGNGQGLAGKRSGLFYEIIRLTKEIRPSFVFLENVPAIRTRGLEQVIKEFTEVGYDCRWTMLSASDVGAPHKRERWFLLAYPSGGQLWLESGRVVYRGKDSAQPRDNGQEESLADSYRAREQSEQGKHDRTGNSSAKMAKPMREGLERFSEPEAPRARKQRRLETSDSSLFDGQFWAFEPSVGRVANGVSNRMDRIKCLGNSVVPYQVKRAFEMLVGINAEKSL